MTLKDANVAMAELLDATIRLKAAEAARDKDVLAVQQKYGSKIALHSAAIEVLEGRLAEFAREVSAKNLKLTGGTITLRKATTPALIPLEGWTWEKVEAKVRRIWKSKFFHKPKPPALDKVALKSDLDESQLERCGLQLDPAEHFHYTLDKLEAAA